MRDGTTGLAAEARPAPVRVGLVGAGKRGSALLHLLLDWPEATVAVVIDRRLDAPGLAQAQAIGIPTTTDPLDVFRHPVDLVLEVTGQPAVLEELLCARPTSVEVIGARSVQFFWDFLQEKVKAARQLRAEKLKALSALTRFITCGRDSVQVMHEVAKAATTLLGGKLARVWVADPQERVLRIHGSFGLDPAFEALVTDFPAIPWGKGLIGRIFEARAPEYISDVREDPRWLNRRLLEEGGFHAFAGLPLVTCERVVGILSVLFGERREFRPEDRDLMSLLADQAAIAIENARLYGEVKRRLGEAQALLEMARIFSSTLEMKPLLKEVALRTARAVGAERCSINLWRNGQVVPVMSQFADGHVDPDLWKKFKAMGPLAVEQVPAHAEAIRSKKAIVVEDVVGSGLLPGFWTETFGVRSALVVPLIRKDEVIGTMDLDDTSGPHPWDPAQIDLAMTIASQVALVLDHAVLYKSIREQAGELAALREVGATLTSTLDLRTILEGIADSAIRLIGSQRCAVFELDPRDHRLHARASRGMRPDQPFMPMKLGQGAAGSAALQRQPIFSPDVHHQPLPGYDDLWEEAGMTLREVIRRRRYRAILAVPLISRETVLGAICIYWDKVHSYDEREVRLLTALAQQAAVAIENARLYEEAQHRHRESSGLLSVARALDPTLGHYEIARRVAREVTHFFGADTSIFFELDEAGEHSTAVAGYHVPEALWNPSYRVSATDPAPFIIEARETGRPVASSDVSTDPRFDHPTIRTMPIQPRSVLCNRVLIKGRPLGALLTFWWTESHRFTEGELRLAASLATQMALVLENARLYEETQQALDALKAKNADLDSFVYIVSHDLKAPLMSIQGMSSILLEEHEARLDAEGQHYLERIRANIQQMERLIEDLLALSRLGRERRAPERVRLAELVDDLLLELAEPIRARGIQVVRQNLGTIWAVQTQMEQVLGNLLSNAIKYMGDAPSPAVEVGTVDKGGFVECYVKDNGIGIDPAYHARVFELFQRLKEVDTDGTGVGLAIVKKIVEGAGGRVWVESAKGQGATFRFTWPKGPRRGGDGSA